MLHKPRLLIFLNRLSTGGPATNTVSTAAILSREFDILLVAGEPMPDEQAADFLLEQYKGFRFEKITTLKRTILPGHDLRSYRRIKQIIREFQPDIMHTHGAKPGVLGRLAAWRLNVPVIIHTFHGHVFHSYFNVVVSKLIVWMERMLAKISTAVLAINDTLKKELVEKYRVAGSAKVKLIRLGIETAHFSDAGGGKREQFRKEFGLHNEEVAIGIIGRLVPVKQHTVFLELAEQLLSEGLSTKLRFFIVGDGAEKSRLQKMLQDKKIAFADKRSEINESANIIFTSWRNDMDVVYAGLDIVMLTSLNEGTPVSIMEAMSAGKPVVSTNAGGVAELIEQGNTGFIAADKIIMKEQLLRLIGSATLRRETGAKAALIAAQQFSKTVEAESLKGLYHLFLEKN